MVVIAGTGGTAITTNGLCSRFAEARISARTSSGNVQGRKATRAANRQGSVAQLDTRGMAALYTKKANRQRLAEEAAALLIPEPKKNVYSRTLSSGAGNGSKNQDKSIS